MKKTILRFAPFLLLASLMSGCGGSGNGPSATAAGVQKNGAVRQAVNYPDLPAGSFCVDLRNASNGQLPDNQIYVEIVSLPGGKVTYVDATGTGVENGPQDNGTLGVVSTGKANENLAAHAFTLAQLRNGLLYLPGDAEYVGTRIFISIGKPLQMKVNQTADGYIQPDIDNPLDPNYTTPFDWFEMAYSPQSNPKVAFGGNITQVDEFSIPMSFSVQGVKGTVINRGITLGTNSSSGEMTRDALIDKYMRDPAIDAPFKTLAQRDQTGKVVRLVSPYHGAAFRPGGMAQNYFDAYVDSIWQYYASNELNFRDQSDGSGNSYQGRVVGGPNGQQYLQVSRNGGPVFNMAKPGTYDVLTNNGVLQPGGTDANAFGAILAGAINRHVATKPQDWLNAASFYQNAPANEWGRFWHDVSIDHLAYGFGFDDTADQSSVAILPADEYLSKLTISIGW